MLTKDLEKRLCQRYWAYVEKFKNIGKQLDDLMPGDPQYEGILATYQYYNGILRGHSEWMYLLEIDPEEYT